MVPANPFTISLNICLIFPPKALKIEISELKDLCRMFKTYADADATLQGWW